MSIATYPHYLPKKFKQLYSLDSGKCRKKFAFRIGFIGSPINRYDDELLGKVLDTRYFENFTNEQLKGTKAATNRAKALLKKRMSKAYPTERNRLVYAGLMEGRNEQSRIEQLHQALVWLETRDIDIICVQYQWMEMAISGSSTLVYDFSKLTPLLMDP
ncbi:MAG: hypothetical protein AAFY76_03460 [Cyanobacteria bacterium J06649_11]